MSRLLAIPLLAIIGLAGCQTCPCQPNPMNRSLFAPRANCDVCPPPASPGMRFFPTPPPARSPMLYPNRPPITTIETPNRPPSATIEPPIRSGQPAPRADAAFPPADQAPPLDPTPPDFGSGSGSRSDKPKNGKEPPIGTNPEKERVLDIPGKDKDAEAPKEKMPEIPLDPRGKSDTEPGLLNIPGYQVVSDKISVGLKPDLEGIAWLKKKGFKTVLHLRQPSEGNAWAKNIYKSRGFNYLTIEVSPKTLTKEVYESFVKEITNEENAPIFVWDDANRALMATMMFLYHRIELKESDKDAVAAAERYGQAFRDDEPKHKEMWLAAQKLLETLSPK